MSISRLLAAAGMAVLSMALVATPAMATPGGGPTSRVVGGTPADLATTTWYAFLKIDWGDVRGASACGGTVIGPRSIVTAAHCVTREDTTIPQSAGEVARSLAWVNPAIYPDPFATPPPVGGIGWSKVDVHPGWNRDTAENDIAIITTNTAMVTTPVAYSANAAGPSQGTPLQVFGMGVTTEGGKHSNVTLVGSVIDMAGVSGPCGTYPGPPPGSVTYFPATQICAGVPGDWVGACSGDSGGPLVTTTVPRRLVGVPSHLFGCANPNYPGLYSRVSTYAAWIQAKTGIAPDTTWPPPVPPIVDQTPSATCIRQPARVRRAGLTVLENAACRTNAGQRVQVTASGVATRGDRRNWRIIRGANGKVSIRTYGYHLKLRVAWKAPATTGYTAYLATRTYRT